MPEDGPAEWALYQDYFAEYRDCVRRYLAHAAADRERIRRLMESATREYNRRLTMP